MKHNSKSDGYEVLLSAFQKSLGEVFGQGGQSNFTNIPDSSVSLDIHRLGDVTNANKEIFLPFTPPKGFTAFITSYALFSDALLESDIEFIPEINGQRVLVYHGNPQITKGRLPYKLSLGMSSDLSNTGLRECNLVVRDTDQLNWYVTQKNSSAQTMGIRCVGYLISNSKIAEPFTGG